MLNRLLPALALAALLSAQQNQLDASKSIYAVMAALDAAGELPDVNSPSNHPLRKALREEILRRKPASLADLKDYFRQRRQDSPQATMRLYTTWGILNQGPPDFAFKLRNHQLPPDLTAFDGLAPLLAKFWSETQMDELWRQSQSAIERELTRYQPGVLKAVQEVSAYLRVPISNAERGRSFQIYVDLIGAPNQYNFATFLNDYYVAVTHFAEPPIADIRTAYLHYLVDPYITRSMEKLEQKKAIGDYAQASPILAEHYKNDFLLLATKCLIRAIEARLAYGGAQLKQQLVDRAMSEGFILTAFFYEQLALYEKQEQSMRYFFPEMVTALDLRKEDKRIEKIQFATASAVRVVKPPPPPPEPELSPAEQSLNKAEELYKQRDLDAARNAFIEALNQTERRPLHARAYYGLARIAALKREPELAEKLFAKTLELEPEPMEKGWTLIYLARLSEASGETAKAREYYQAALTVEGASDAAKNAAQQALSKP